MDICRVLSGLNSVSPSEFDFSSDAITSGKLPDPSLFFTWYCEKAREIEKHTGTAEFSLKLLELALASLPSNARIAKRFILATRHSLIRYDAHINHLASKLNQEGTTEEEKGTILQTLRSIDLRTFEMGTRPALKVEEQAGDDNEEVESDNVEDFASSDWNLELEILDLIMEARINEAFNRAQQGIFFPAALLEKYASNPVEWLVKYCKALTQESQIYFDSIKNNSIQIISPEVCKDSWSQAINSYLGSDLASFGEEQTVSLILVKSKMAQTVLAGLKKSHFPVNNNNDDDGVYF